MRLDTRVQVPGLILGQGPSDPRPTVRENVKILGDLRKDFDFSQPPRRPLLLPLHPKFH